MRSLLDCAKRLISRIYWWAPEECWPNEIWTDCLQQVCRPPSWGVWHGMLEHGQGMLAPVPPQAACCPLQSARPHHSGGSCLSKGSPGSVGLAISVAQLSSHVAAALQRTFRVLWQEFIWIPLCGTERPCISSAHMGYLWKATVYLFVRSV